MLQPGEKDIRWGTWTLLSRGKTRTENPGEQTKRSARRPCDDETASFPRKINGFRKERKLIEEISAIQKSEALGLYKQLGKVIPKNGRNRTKPDNETVYYLIGNVWSRYEP